MSAIEWTDETWNPVSGCDRVSAGCDSCYALTMARRLKAMGNPKYQRDGDLRTSGPGFGVTTHADVLDLPLRWKRPRRVFVNSMSDLFHDSVPDEYIAKVWAVMAMSPNHTFQVLTKRHGRMRSLLSSPAFRVACEKAEDEILCDPEMPIAQYARDQQLKRWWTHFDGPLRNVWLGVSVEDQRWADIRIPALLETPAAVRWISAEPLLGPVLLRDDWIGADPYRRDEPSLDWVVVGGESGPGARPMHPGWARSLRDQCQQASVPFFMKQWGEWIPEALGAQVITRHTAKNARYADLDGGHRPANVGARNGAATCHRVGKKLSGRELDGRTWDEFPQSSLPEGGQGA